tara:strand:+ start:965 stop:1132 length:168 start_codon:yes stop_codon:yes gene_type:complete
MNNSLEFFNIIDDLASSAEYFRNDKNFNPPEKMVETLDEIAAELFNMVLDEQSKQ